MCHWSMRSKGRLKLPENDPLFLTTEKLLGKGDFWGKRDYFGALKIVPGYGKMAVSYTHLTLPTKLEV